MSTEYTLELLHVADQEAKSASVDDAPRFSAVWNYLLDEEVGADGTLLLASGDQWLPGLFYDASGDEELYGLTGAADILIQNELGIQASAFGNHEFDNGNAIIADLLQPLPEGHGGALPYAGANFPYLGGNIDFSANQDIVDDNGNTIRGLAPLVTENGQLASDIPGQIAEWVIVEDDNGTQYGVVSVSAPSIDEGLSSPTDTDVQPDGPDGSDNDVIAALIQEDVDALLAANPDIDKVILLAHMQQIEIEKDLATKLSDVDIIIAGGSNTRLFDDDDVGFGTDEAQGEYPFFTKDADGNDIAVVNTDANYKYVGRLVIDFDENGVIVPESYDFTVSGAYATDQANLDRLGIDFDSWADPEIVAITDGVRGVIEEGESEFYAITEEFLNGNRFGGGGGRDGVRSQETNLANLTGDANLAYAKSFDDSVVVSVKNGGGIRASIGAETVPGGGLGDPVRTPPEEVPGVKPEGGISSNDVANVLAFNNGLILLSVTAEELVAVIEGGVADFQDVDTEAGGYLHFAGVRFSFDPDLPPGDRILNAAIVDEETGAVLAELVRDGDLVDNGDQTFRIVTLDFLANEGNQFDGVGTDRVDLGTLPPSPTYDTVDTFMPGGEQDALAEYLNVAFGPEGERTITAEDTTQASDERIQNVDAREDAVFGPGDGGGESLRVATYNASLFRPEDGMLADELSTPDSEQAQNIAEVIQRERPDVLLVNEFDYDVDEVAAQGFQENYLEVPQGEQEAIVYPYRYVAASNTGLPSGFDLNNDGEVTLGNDALGFGLHAGQYSFVVYSMYPIETESVRTFQDFLWKDMPGALLFDPDPTGRPLFDPDRPFDPADPTDVDTSFFTAEEVEILRLSSKNHADVPVNVDGEIVHILASHPTPPTFDGIEDWNGKRNFDEIRLWADYIAGEDYLVDDNGVAGGLDDGARFVIVGDYNADPLDGDSRAGAADQLVDNPLIIGSATDATITPSSTGAVELGDGDPFDTADFSETEDATGEVARDSLRVDYALPSVNGLQYLGGEVVWPADAAEDPLAPIINDPTQTSDHRMVVVDLELTDADSGAGAPLAVASLEFLGSTSFAAGTEFAGTVVGGLSGIAYDGDAGSYLTISDDQVDYRFYTVAIDLADGSLDDGDVEIVGVTPLLDADGLPLAEGTLDTEGLALTPDGTALVTSEGFVGGERGFVDPSIDEFALSGIQVGELPVFAKYSADPGGQLGVRSNLALESATVTPAGSSFFTATENALIQDGAAATPTNGSPSRIIEYDLETGAPVAEYVYENGPVPNAPVPADAFAVNGLVELLAIDDQGALLALERDFSVGVEQTGTGHGGFLYELSTDDADNVLDDLALDQVVPPTPVTRELLLDFSTLGITVDNLEGLAWGPDLADGRNTLIVVSDDNFSDSQSTQFLAFAVELFDPDADEPVDDTADVAPPVDTGMMIDGIA